MKNLPLVLPIQGRVVQVNEAVVAFFTLCQKEKGPALPHHPAPIENSAPKPPKYIVISQALNCTQPPDTTAISHPALRLRLIALTDLS